jgi:Zn ribbon nucleic-acid-binding protein
MSELLKACPCCNGFVEINIWAEIAYEAKCKLCGLTMRKNTFDELVQSWNHRTGVVGLSREQAEEIGDAIILIESEIKHINHCSLDQSNKQRKQNNWALSYWMRDHIWVSSEHALKHLAELQSQLATVQIGKEERKV